MNNRKRISGWVAFCVAAIFIAGCIPEDSLQWSDDGSVGLLGIQEALYLVNGKTGELTEIAKQNVQPWPAITRDGTLIAYSQAVECSSLSQGLKQLPPGQVKIIESYAEQIKNNVLKAGGLTNNEFPFPDECIMTPENYSNWPIRYLCENAEPDLLKVLPDEAIKKGKEMAIGYFQLVVVPVKALQEKRTLTTSLFKMIGLKFSPNKKHLAYLMHTQEGETSNSFEEDALYIASLENDVKAMLVNHRVAAGYDWRADGRAIAYIRADSDNLRNDDVILGMLEEVIVDDANGNLQAEPIANSEQGSVWTHRCTGQSSSSAGMLFYPWQKVQYGLDNRIFFSSSVLSLPTSIRDEPKWSLFCYDPVTGTVADVLGLNVSNYTSQTMTMLQFALSPDGKGVLLPIEKNRFIRYELGTDNVTIPVEENKGFGEEEISAFLPSWKGSSEMSFLVSENSHFLIKAKEPGDKPARKEIVVLDRTGKDSRILSESWPDEIMEGFKADQSSGTLPIPPF